MLSYPRDFTWEQLTKILRHFGYEECKGGKTGGSRKKFANGDKHIIRLHKPHPANILKRYQLEEVIGALKERGYDFWLAYLCPHLAGFFMVNYE